MLFIYHGLYVNGWVTPPTLCLERNYLIDFINYFSLLTLFNLPSGGSWHRSTAGGGWLSKASVPVPQHSPIASLQPPFSMHITGLWADPAGAGKDRVSFGHRGDQCPLPTALPTQGTTGLHQTDFGATPHFGCALLWIAKAVSKQHAQDSVK